MKPLIEQFADYLSLNGMSENYYYRIKKFIKYVNEKNLNYKDFDFSKITEFILFLKLKTSEPETINAHINALKQFFKFLLLNKLVTEENLNAINKLPYQKRTEKIKPEFTPEDLKFLAERAMVWLRSYIHPLKLKAILYFYYFTGIRRCEIFNIARKDIDLEKCTAIVRLPSKNKKEKIVCFNNRVADILQDYFIREPEENTENNAFNLTIGKLQNISKNIKPILKGKNITWHSFRHGFANMLEANGISVLSAQKLLGHNSLSSTLRYYKPKTKTAINEYQAKIKDTIPKPKPLKEKKKRQLLQLKEEDIELEDLPDLE